MPLRARRSRREPYGAPEGNISERQQCLEEITPRLTETKGVPGCPYGASLRDIPFWQAGTQEGVFFET